MAIKTNEIITKTDIDSLKQKIKTLYEKRTLTVEGRTLSDASQQNHAAILNADTSDNKKIISTSDLGALLDACLVINDIPNLVTLAHNENKYIFHNSSNEDVLTWLSNEKINATGNSSEHGCRGACVGLCSGSCYNSCINSCKNESSVGPSAYKSGTWHWDSSKTEGMYNGSCGSEACDSGCDGRCDMNCFKDCSENCTGCGGQCGGCSSGCVYSCTGCSENCGSQCSGSCGNHCDNACDNACHNSCKDGCATDCTSGCYGSTTGGTYT